jgi:hypothetical protein
MRNTHRSPQQRKHFARLIPSIERSRQFGEYALYDTHSRSVKRFLTESALPLALALPRPLALLLAPFTSVTADEGGSDSFRPCRTTRRSRGALRHRGRADLRSTRGSTDAPPA